MGTICYWEKRFVEKNRSAKKHSCNNTYLYKLDLVFCKSVLYKKYHCTNVKHIFVFTLTFFAKTLGYKYILHCSFVQEIEKQDWFIILVNEKATFSYPPKGKKVWHFSPRLAKYALYDCSGTHSVRFCNMCISFQKM